jgi:hypothetical protein
LDYGLLLLERLCQPLDALPGLLDRQCRCLELCLWRANNASLHLLLCERGRLHLVDLCHLHERLLQPGVPRDLCVQHLYLLHELELDHVRLLLLVVQPGLQRLLLNLHLLPLL